MSRGRGLLHVCFEQLLDLRLQQVAQAMDSFSDVLGIHGREVQPHMAVVVPMRIEGNTRNICDLGADRLTQHGRRVDMLRNLHPYKQTPLRVSPTGACREVLFKSGDHCILLLEILAPNDGDVIIQPATADKLIRQVLSIGRRTEVRRLLTNDELVHNVFAGDHPPQTKPGETDLRERAQFYDVILATQRQQGGNWLTLKADLPVRIVFDLSLIHISEPTRLGMISYAV